MHYFIIAGEASGDLHGSHLIRAIKAHDSEAVINFLGGDKMAAEAGSEPIIHYREMAFMGFSEVLRNLGKVTGNLSRAKTALEVASPDALILIDYPSFNLKMASKAARLGIPVYYYISPKIWAWKKWRVRDIKRLVRCVFCILPFEPDFYREHDYRQAVYVGNPSVGEIDADMAKALPRDEFLAKHRLRDRPLIALMPGSRRGEIRNNLPIMVAAADMFPQYRAVIIGAPGIDDSLYSECGSKNVPVVREDSATEVLVHCRAALVTSGTATLEASLAGIPQVVCYRANGSKLSYEIMSRVLDVEFVSLPNLIAGREIVPEMLLHNCTPELVADKLGPLLRLDTAARQAQLEGYAHVRSVLGTGDAADNAARIIVKDRRKAKA